MFGWTFFFAVLIMLTVPVWAPPTSHTVQRSVRTAVLATTESYSLESPHPYDNNYDRNWTITKSGAVRIRVHFYRIDVESTYDHVYVYDYAGTQLNDFVGSYTDTWSLWSDGPSIRVRLKTDGSVTNWGFGIDQIEYETSNSTTTTSVSGNVLFSGNTVSGNLETEESDVWYIDVDSGCARMEVVLRGPSGADFDLYGRLGSAPTLGTNDWSSTNVGNDDFILPTPPSGRWYIMVYAYSGSGTYQLTVYLSYGTVTGGGMVTALDFGGRILSLIAVVVALVVLSKIT